MLRSKLYFYNSLAPIVQLFLTGRQALIYCPNAIGSFVQGRASSYKLRQGTSSSPSEDEKVGPTKARILSIPSSTT